MVGGKTLEMERRIVRGESVSTKHPANISILGDLTNLHISDMHEVGKPLWRSKAYAVRELMEQLGWSLNRLHPE